LSGENAGVYTSDAGANSCSAFHEGTSNTLDAQHQNCNFLLDDLSFGLKRFMRHTQFRAYLISVLLHFHLR